MIATGWAALRPFRRLITRLAAGNRTTTVGSVPGTLSDPTDAPAEDRNGTGTPIGGSGVPVPSIRGGAGDPQHPAAAPEETIICCACGQPLADRTTARCWMAPEGIAVAADLACLLWLGETELGLADS